MNFLVDMPLSPDLAGWLRAQGHDAVHASDLSLHQSPDEMILAAAAGQNRVIITADLDFPMLLAISRAGGPGLIPLRGGNYTEAESLECVPDAVLDAAKCVFHSSYTLRILQQREGRLITE